MTVLSHFEPAAGHQRVLERLTAASPEIFGRQVDLPDVTVDDDP
jgi:hypothetical protein